MLTWANQITIVRILLIIPFVICMLKVNEAEHSVLVRYVALCIFLFMCISDFLDGYMARVKHQVTKIGSFLDPMADKLLIMCACVLLASKKTGIEGFILPQAVVVLIIGKDVLVSLGFIITYFVTSHIHIVPVFIGKLANGTNVDDYVRAIGKTLDRLVERRARILLVFCLAFYPDETLGVELRGVLEAASAQGRAIHFHPAFHRALVRRQQATAAAGQ